jgi:hypothetical protein
MRLRHQFPLVHGIRRLVELRIRRLCVRFLNRRASATGRLPSPVGCRAHRQLCARQRPFVFSTTAGRCSSDGEDMHYRVRRLTRSINEFPHNLDANKGFRFMRAFDYQVAPVPCSGTARNRPGISRTGENWTVLRRLFRAWCRRELFHHAIHELLKQLRASDRGTFSKQGNDDPVATQKVRCCARPCSGCT